MRAPSTKYGASDAEQLPRIEDTPDVRRASAELAQAKQAFERATELHKRQLISQQMLDDADTALRLKRPPMMPRCRRRRTSGPISTHRRRRMKLAERQCEDASIRAPFDGYVQQRMVSLGELVKAQMPVMTVVRVDPLKLLSEIPERMAPWVKVGQPLTLRVDAFPDKPFTATVSRISPAVNTQTRTFAFEALAPNAEALLKPGTFARVRLETSLVEQVMTIPYAAMQYRYGVYRAFAVEGDRLEARELKTGDRVGDRMEILDGLEHGDRVAVTDVDTLTDGMTGRGRRRVAMLSELCVRRPVFATMLVMSLVVLGLFSFRDLGVDLFPKADPAQVNVSLRLPGASPDEMTSSVIMPMENALSGIAGIDQMTANVNTGGTANIPSGSSSRATWRTPPTRCAKKSPARCGPFRPRRCPRSSRSRIPTPIRS